MKLGAVGQKILNKRENYEEYLLGYLRVGAAKEAPMLKQAQFLAAMTEAKILLDADEKSAIAAFYKDYEISETKEVQLEKLMGAIGLPAQTYGSGMRPRTRVRVLTDDERGVCMQLLKDIKRKGDMEGRSAKETIVFEFKKKNVQQILPYDFLNAVETAYGPPFAE